VLVIKISLVFHLGFSPIYRPFPFSSVHNPFFLGFKGFLFFSNFFRSRLTMNVFEF